MTSSRIPLKQVLFALGAYGPARRAYRFLYRSKRRAHNDQVTFFRSFVPRGALCFDIGANKGNKSEALLKAGAQVVAFEPNLLLLPELLARFHDVRGWTLMPTAVGNTAGISLFFAREIDGLSSLDPKGVQEWQGNLARTFSVPVITLDSAIYTFGVPYYCKIDVEGWETHVLSGLTEPIPVISFEFHLTDRNLVSTRDCLRRIATLGPYEVNITPAELNSFLFERWMDLGEFTTWFPGDLSQVLRDELYGEIYVRVRRGTEHEA